MKVYLLLAHPDTNSFNGHIADAIEVDLLSAGDQVIIADLDQSLPSSGSSQQGGGLTGGLTGGGLTGGGFTGGGGFPGGGGGFAPPGGR